MFKDMYLKDVVFGFDLGNTFFHDDSRGNKIFFPRAREVVSLCCNYCKNVYVISKVNEKQHKQALETLKRHRIYSLTGLRSNHVFFCEERYQKGIIARKLGINYFVDDRPEVMAHMDKTVYKILFNPNPIEIKQFKQEHLPVVHSWSEIEHILFSSNNII